MNGLKLTVTLCRPGRGRETFPALVSREVRPDSRLDGSWRLTVFDAALTHGLFHVNFDLEELTFPQLELACRTRSRLYEMLVSEFLCVSDADCRQQLSVSLSPSVLGD